MPNNTEIKLEVIVWNSDNDHRLLLPIIKQCHSESVFRAPSFIEEKATRSLVNHIGHKNNALLVAKKGDHVLGLIALTAEALMFSDHKYASVLLFYISRTARSGPACRRLMSAMKKWCELSHIEGLTMHVTSGERSESSHRLLSKIGFALTGGNYIATFNQTLSATT